MARKNESATYSLSMDEIAALEAMAHSLGFRYGERGNTSKMLRAIARGDLAVGEYLKKPVTNAAEIRRKLEEIRSLL